MEEAPVFAKQEYDGAIDTNVSYKCPSCPEEFIDLRLYRMHRKSHFLLNRTCQQCHLVCQSVGKLRSHMYGHLGMRPYRCQHCNKRYTSEHNLKQHTRMHTNEKRYKCQECGAAFRYLASLRSHSICHTEINEFICKMCNEVISTLDQYRQHMRSHGQHTTIKCYVCNMEFRCERTLQSHLKQHPNLTYPCEYCSKLFPTLYRLKRHIKRAHIPNVCNICGATNTSAAASSVFYDRSEYTKHMRAHETSRLQMQPNTCPHCGKTYERPKNLSEHIRVQHKANGEVNQCELCLKEFINGALLRNHQKTHRKQFACEFCSKLFSSRYALKMHSLTHTKIKQYACSLCGKAFSTKTGLKCHEATHSDERNFACERCEKTFKSKRRLYVHSLSHATVARFECPTCLARFTTRHYLKSHLGTHSKVKPYECERCASKFKHKKSLNKHVMNVCQRGRRGRLKTQHSSINGPSLSCSSKSKSRQPFGLLTSVRRRRTKNNNCSWTCFCPIGQWGITCTTDWRQTCGC